MGETYLLITFVHGVTTLRMVDRDDLQEWSEKVAEEGDWVQVNVDHIRGAPSASMDALTGSGSSKAFLVIRDPISTVVESVDDPDPVVRRAYKPRPGFDIPDWLTIRVGREILFSRLNEGVYCPLCRQAACRRSRPLNESMALSLRALCKLYQREGRAVTSKELAAYMREQGTDRVSHPSGSLATMRCSRVRTRHVAGTSAMGHGSRPNSDSNSRQVRSRFRSG